MDMGQGQPKVKVYTISVDDGDHWQDRGPGRVSVEHLEQAGAMGLVVVSDDDSSRTHALVVHRITREETYQRQGKTDTIISWTDHERGHDIALSFASLETCETIWNQIMREQARAAPLPSENGLRRRMVDEMEPAGPNDEFQDGAMGGPVDLPSPELGNLEQMAKILGELTNFQKEHVAAQMLQGGHIQKLLALFQTCEDLEDTASLRHLYVIIKGAIMLNDTNLLETMFSEDHVMDVVGALEYDAELAEPQKHRDFLRDVVVFKEVVPIRQPSIKAKIHQTYRMGYIKDVILPRVLDDGTFATLSSLMMFNNMEVVLALLDDPNFLGDLFTKFKATSPTSEDWADLVAFLQELTSLSKSLQGGHRAALHSQLIRLGLFEVITEVLDSGSKQLKLRATDVLLSTLHHDPVPLREFMLHQSDNALFTALVQLLVSGADGGLQEQATEVLRVLLDPESMTQSTEKNDFLGKFYDDYIGQLVGVIVSSTERTHKGTKAQTASAGALGLIVDVLCFCVQNHGYRIKFYTLKNNVMEKVLKLLERRERWLVVAAVRYLRTCLGLKDEFYNRAIISNRMLDPVFRVFLANGTRYNLLNSVVLELLDFIKKENIKSLVQHIVEEYYPQLEGVDYVDTISGLKLKYEQSQERSREGAFASAQLQAQRIRKDERALDKSEESYFGEDDDDDEAPGPSLASPAEYRPNGAASAQLPFPRLVDYDDDDDDDDNMKATTPSGAKRGSESSGPAGKRIRFGEHAESPHRFQLSSPPLLKPGGPLLWQNR